MTQRYPQRKSPRLQGYDGSNPHEMATTGVVPTVLSPSFAPGSLGAVVGSYKSGVTRRVREALQSPDLLVWQWRYHDHIIRDDMDLNRIRDYILSNPARWHEDIFYTL